MRGTGSRGAEVDADGGTRQANEFDCPELPFEKG